MNKHLQSNLWKLFLMELTTRRNYIPILALYFLTLPNATAQQIGLYTGISWLAGFILEIPSGYLSDIFGHKKTLNNPFFTQKMVEELIFQLLRYAVSKSSNKLDDQILAAFEEQRSK